MKKSLKIFAVAAIALCSCSANTENNTEMTAENSTLNVLETRRSIRQYKNEMPDRKLLEEVLEAGTYAPTSRGAQSPVIVAVTDRETRDLLSKMNAEVMQSDSDPFYGAPAVFVVLAPADAANRVYDGSLVMGNLMNAAEAVGLGTCWIHRAKEMFETERGRELLKQWGLEGEYEGIANCIIGYPEGEHPKAAPRKADYIHWVE